VETPVPPSKRLAVLVAEDNAVMQTVIKFMLISWGYDPILVPDGARAWEILQGNSSPRLALLDWMLPGMDGVEICRRVRAAGKEPYTYVVLLSARSEAADLVRAMEAGADDYLTKPFDAGELRVRLNAGSRILRLQEQLVAAREALREQASRDSLTGLLNHAYVLGALECELERADADGRPIAILLADLDRFRHINDSFGHPAGDEVLREFGRRLIGAAPADAAVGRYGGEEFLVVLPGYDGAAAQGVADRIGEAVGDTVFTAGAASFPVTCSIGVACRERPFASDVMGRLRQADEALFFAKREVTAEKTVAV
jgi:two-component system, cell cycle response regulator